MRIKINKPTQKGIEELIRLERKMNEKKHPERKAIAMEICNLISNPKSKYCANEYILCEIP